MSESAPVLDQSPSWVTLGRLPEDGLSSAAPRTLEREADAAAQDGEEAAGAGGRERNEEGRIGREEERVLSRGVATRRDAARTRF